MEKITVLDEAAQVPWDVIKKTSDRYVAYKEIAMETIEDILREIRRRNHGCPLDAEASHSTVEDILCLADRIEAAYRREFDEAARALDKLTEGICSHCDMQIDCAEGEDGMPTMCNAMCGVRKFIKEHKMEEKSNGFPF